MLSRNNGRPEAIHVNSEPNAATPAPHGDTSPLVTLVPDLDRWLSEEERRLVSRFQVPVLTAFDGPLDLGGTLGDTNAFALVIVDGMVARTLGLAGHAGLQLLGPGDLITRSGEGASDLISQPGLRAQGMVRCAVLDDRVLALIQRFPRLVEGLQVRGEDQQQRLLAQLMICQLPRVDERVLALMWLLAETWGRVTHNGTVLPVRLTHDTIGLLVGARRSTVTLALGSLEQRGALQRRSDDWLILERPEEPVPAMVQAAGLPRLATSTTSSWSEPAVMRVAESPLQAMGRLRKRQAATVAQSEAVMSAADVAFRRSQWLLERIAVRRSGLEGLHHEDDAADLSIVLDGSER
jgi:CRP/FNR family transcriptional regulator, cyclic AMP receptor protein